MPSSSDDLILINEDNFEIRNLTNSQSKALNEDAIEFLNSHWRFCYHFEAINTKAGNNQNFIFSKFECYPEVRWFDRLQREANTRNKTTIKQLFCRSIIDGIQFATITIDIKIIPNATPQIMFNSQNNQFTTTAGVLKIHKNW